MLFWTQKSRSEPPRWLRGLRDLGAFDLRILCTTTTPPAAAPTPTPTATATATADGRLGRFPQKLSLPDLQSRYSQVYLHTALREQKAETQRLKRELRSCRVECLGEESWSAPCYTGSSPKQRAGARSDRLGVPPILSIHLESPPTFFLGIFRKGPF